MDKDEWQRLAVSRDVLDHGFVRLEDSMADDLSVINSARVSFNKYVKAMGEGDDKLIHFLMKNRHGTPFEHAVFRFHVKVPMFVAREWQRHRIGSYNEWSARYSELKPEFYVPALQDVRTQTGKPGHYKFERMVGYEAREFVARLRASSEKAFQNYQAAISDGVAKELARLFLPVNIYTEYYWTVNARALMNFLSLRNAPQAMFEIRQYAEKVEEMFAEHMPVTHAAFVGNDRTAP